MLYEYECENCEATLEVEQKIKDKPLKECPECKEEALKRVIGKTSFILKGKGWFKDGY